MHTFHLLHIEPNPDDRLELARAWAKTSRMGVVHSLSSASNALLFLNALGPFRSSPRPQAILFDMDLPRCVGMDFLEMLRGNHRFRDIPVVVLLGSEAQVDQDRFRALAVARWFLKPKNVAGYCDILRSLPVELVGG